MNLLLGSQLQMWYDIKFRMELVPEDFQTQHFTEFLNEITAKMWEIVNELEYDPTDWLLE